MYFRSDVVKRSRTVHIGTPDLFMQRLHGGPLMLLSCALGMAIISWPFDAMGENRYALRYSTQKLMDIRTDRIHHVRDKTAEIPRERVMQH